MPYAYSFITPTNQRLGDAVENALIDDLYAEGVTLTEHYDLMTTLLDAYSTVRPFRRKH